MVLLNVKMQFTLAELMAEERRLAAMTEPLPICKSLVEEAVRLMISLEASQQTVKKGPRPLPSKGETGAQTAEAPRPTPRKRDLNPVLPPGSPRPIEAKGKQGIDLRFGLGSQRLADLSTSDTKETAVESEEEVPLAPSWALRGGKYQSPKKCDDLQSNRSKPSDLLTRAVYASLAIARFRKQWAQRIGRTSMKTIETGRQLVRKTSFRLKEHLKAYSVVAEIDRRLEENLRQKLERENESEERELMRINERIVRSVEMHCVDVREVFFVKVYNFLRVTTFMNHARDIMIVVTKPNEMAIFPPLYLAEADLMVAANEFYTRSNKYKADVAEPVPHYQPRMSLEYEEDLRDRPELPDYAVHYIFMLGRLTILTELPTLLGVENVVEPGIAVASGRITVSALGNYEQMSIQGWRPVNQGPDPKMKLAFVHALIEAKELVSGSELESEQLREIQKDLQQHTSVIQDLNERDAVILNALLCNGIAPTQKTARSPIASPVSDKYRMVQQSSKKKLIVRPTTAGAWRRAAQSHKDKDSLNNAEKMRINSKIMGFRRRQDTGKASSTIRPIAISSTNVIAKTASEPAFLKPLAKRGAVAGTHLNHNKMEPRPNSAKKNASAVVNVRTVP